MNVNQYIGEQFFKTVFKGTEQECRDEKARLDKERESYLEEYKRICKDKCYMDIKYTIT